MDKIELFNGKEAEVLSASGYDDGYYWSYAGKIKIDDEIYFMNYTGSGSGYIKGYYSFEKEGYETEILSGVDRDEIEVDDDESFISAVQSNYRSFAESGAKYSYVSCEVNMGYFETYIDGEKIIDEEMEYEQEEEYESEEAPMINENTNPNASPSTSAKKIYNVIHSYDEDGGFGDPIGNTELIATFSSRKKAEEFVDKYENPHVYAKPYGDLYCGILKIKEVEIDIEPPRNKMWWIDPDLTNLTDIDEVLFAIESSDDPDDICKKLPEETLNNEKIKDAIKEYCLEETYKNLYGKKIALIGSDEGIKKGEEKITPSLKKNLSKNDSEKVDD